MKPLLHLAGRLALAGLATAITLSGCAAPTPSVTTIRIGSKNFTEQFIVGEMYALVLEDAGFKVERKLNLGGTPVAQAALVAGEIDLYPEYTGTGLLTVLKLPVNTNAQAVYDTVNAEYQKQFNLRWLAPAPMNNTQALAMRADRAAALGIVTFSDMVAQADQLIMAGPPEFAEREDGLPGLRLMYGDFALKEYKAIDPGLRYQALRSNEVDVVVAFGTDGQIAADNLVLLQDDQGMFPPYQIAPVVRQAVLSANPRVAELLDALAPKLTDAVMQRLNYEVDGKQREPSDVAREFLLAEGLIK